MTYFELSKLNRESKHRTIGNVKMYLRRDENGNPKPISIWVNYKSGRTAEYTRKEELPETVKHFLRNQNKFFKGYAYNGTPVVYYFWLEDALPCEGDKKVLK